MVRRGAVLILICVLGLSIVFQNNVGEKYSIQDGILPVKQHEVSYDIHEPVNITSDTDFEIQGWSGNGSLSNPYLIENLNITTNSSTCIWIMNTTSHFIVTNCLFVSPVFDFVGVQPLCPITLTNVTNGVIRGNHVKNSTAGISGYSLTACTISDNEFNVTNIGIFIWMSNHTTIFNNTQEFDPCYSGLFLNRGINYTVSHNKFGNILDYGISAWSIYNSSFVQNTLIASDDIDDYAWIGIQVWGRYCKVSQNEIAKFHWTGIDVAGGHHMIEDNNVIDGNYGIHISAIDCIVRRNNLSANSGAIVLVAANRTIVYENDITGRNGRYDSGIGMFGGYDCDVYLNEINHVGHGLILQGANGFNISSNSVTDGRYGFAFGWSSNWAGIPEGPFSDCDIKNNSFDGGGLYPVIENYESWDFETIRFEENTVNNRLIGFYAYLDDVELDGDDYGQLFLVSCTEVTIADGDFYGLISDRGEGINFDPGLASAMTFLNCSGFELSGTRFHNNTIGVSIRYSRDCFLQSTSGDDNSEAAISVVSSGNIRISDGYFVNNSEAITFRSSWSSRIYNCLIWDNEEAITLSICPNFTITHNVIFRNIDAIYLGDSDRCNISENDIYSNFRGLLLNSSSYCLITKNNMSDNSGVGICLDFTAHLNNIYENTFANNSPNAICEGSSNQWDDQIDTGNRWSDYTGEGPYIIDEDDQDNYPIIDLPPTTPTGPWEIDPLILLVGGGAVGLLALVIIIREKRRVIIID